MTIAAVAAADLVGAAIAKLSMAPTDVLLVFCPDQWTLEQIGLFDGWMRHCFPQTNMMFLTQSMTAAIVDGDLGQQLRMIEPLACVPPSQLN